MGPGNQVVVDLRFLNDFFGERAREAGRRTHREVGAARIGVGVHAAAVEDVQPGRHVVAQLERAQEAVHAALVAHALQGPEGVVVAGPGDAVGSRSRAQLVAVRYLPVEVDVAGGVGVVTNVAAVVVVGRGAQAAEVNAAGVRALLGAVRAGADVGRVDGRTELVAQLAVYVHAGRGAVVVGVEAGNAFLVGVAQAHVEAAARVAAADGGDVVPGVAVVEGRAGLVVGVGAVFATVHVSSGAVGHGVAARAIGKRHKAQVAGGAGRGDFRIGSAAALRNPVAPRGRRSVAETAGQALAVHGLQGGHAVNAVHAVARAVAHAHFAGTALAFLGGNHDNAVGGAGAPQYAGGRTFQHFHAGNVVGVDVVQARGLHYPGRLVRAGTAVAVQNAVVAHRGVVHRNTVDHDEGLQVAGDGAGAANLDVGAGAGVARGAGDEYARRFARQGGDDAGFARAHQGRALHRGLGRAQLVAVGGQAQGRHHYFAQLLHVGGQGHVNCRFGADGFLLAHVAHRADDQRTAPLGHVKREAAVGIGGGAIRSSFH